MGKFNEERIELIRNKINLGELKTIGRFTENGFIRERKMGFAKLIKYIFVKIC